MGRMAEVGWQNSTSDFRRHNGTIGWRGVVFRHQRMPALLIDSCSLLDCVLFNMIDRGHMVSQPADHGQSFDQGQVFTHSQSFNQDLVGQSVDHSWCDHIQSRTIEY
jgi:hypothetical protein